MIKKTLLAVVAVAAFAASAFAQEDGYKFTVVKENPVTSIKNQASSGTCWSYSTISFLESEAIKKGAPKDIDLAEMFPVWHGYSDKAEKFIRLNGFLNFAQGSSFGDVLYTLKHYGMLPQAELEGLNYGETLNKHSEMESAMKAYLNAINANPNRKLSTAWHAGLEGILEAYLGELPEKFT